MIFLSPLLLSISTNVATLSVSSSYGLKKIHFPKSSMILLAVITSLNILISMYIGKLILPLFDLRLSNIFGAILLSYIGISFIVEYIRLEKKRAGYDTSYYFESPFGYKNVIENPTIIDSDKSNHIDIKESLNLSLAIILNNIFTGLAASITGVNISLSVLLTFIISLISINFGYYNSNICISNWFRKYSDLISGIILIVLGIYELFI
jgi:putative sporulation protein YtaF